MEIIGSLFRRRETFLSRPEWIERPWKLLSKSPLDELFDGLLDLPAIFRQFDKLSQETNQTVLQDGFRDIIEKCLKVESAWRGLYGNFETSVPGPLYWPELSTLESPLDDTNSGKVFPISFHFPSFVIAQFVTSYWSCMMAVHWQLTYTYDKLAATQSSTAFISTTDSLSWSTSTGNGLYSTIPFDLRSGEHDSKWKTMVKNICQSGEYFLQDQMGGLGLMSMLTLLRGCNGVLETVAKEWSREISWITNFMERIQKKFNWPITTFLEE